MIDRAAIDESCKTGCLTIAVILILATLQKLGADAGLMGMLIALTFGFFLQHQVRIVWRSITAERR